MKKLSFFFTWVIVSSLCHNVHPADDDDYDQACPADSYDDPRISGVREADIYNFSYHVLLEAEVEPRHFCGGSIISEYFIVTAAHCLIFCKQIIPEIVVTIQTDDTTKVKIKNRIASRKLYVHPEYRLGDKSFLNDVALIKLDKPLRLGQYLHPAKLPSPESQNWQIFGKQAHLVGFGKRIWTGTTNKKLRAASLRILPDEVCFEMSKIVQPVTKYLYINSHMLCAVTRNLFLGVACPGDSGSGLVIRESGITTIHGISSFISYKHGVSPPTLNIEKPSYFTRVARFVPWIKETMKMALAGDI